MISSESPSKHDFLMFTILSRVSGTMSFPSPVNAGVGGRDACGKPARCGRYVKLRSYAVLSRENCIGVLGIISRYELRHDKREIILQLYRAFEGG